MIYLEEIRSNLQDAIKESGYTQKKIAQKLGYNPSSIGQYISGRAMPALDTFANLCDILNLDANEILCLHNYGIERYDKSIIQQANPINKYEQELINIFDQLTRDNKMRYLGYGDMLLRSQTSK